MEKIKFILLRNKLLLSIMLLALLLRSIHYPFHLNFSTDQAVFSSKAIEIFRDKKIVLQGPTFSINLSQQYVHHGPYIYYFQLFFLLLGGFDPLVSSYIFTVFACLMIFPLFRGVRLLANKNTAWVVVILYAFFPYYLHYTRFFWNPNFQFVLLPLLILLMGEFKKNYSKKIYLLIALFLGILLQFHYQFFLIILGLAVYYFLFKRLKVIYLGIFIIGIAIGFIPLFIYELTHSFANLKTLKLFIEEWEILIEQNKQNTTFAPHYYLSLSFMLALLVFSVLRNKIPKYTSIILAALFIILSAIYYFPPPASARGMAKDWNYLYELKAHELIRSANLNNFNVVHLGYDTLAEVQKYLLKKEGIDINYEDYISNKHLFVITDREDYMNHPAYEVNTFKPSKVIKEWKLNNTYKMYLLERQF